MTYSSPKKKKTPTSCFPAKFDGDVVVNGGPLVLRLVGEANSSRENGHHLCLEDPKIAVLRPIPPLAVSSSSFEDYCSARDWRSD